MKREKLISLPVRGLFLFGTLFILSLIISTLQKQASAQEPIGRVVEIESYGGFDPDSVELNIPKVPGYDIVEVKNTSGTTRVVENHQWPATASKRSDFTLNDGESEEMRFDCPLDHGLWIFETQGTDYELKVAVNCYTKAPTLTQWGTFALASLIIISGIYLLLRRKKAHMA